jgi:hypothetical protein
MAYNPKTGGIWVAEGDACHCYKYGNGEVLLVHNNDITVLFTSWTGTLNNKEYHRHMVTLQKEDFKDRLKERGGIMWWALRSQDIPE